MASVHRWDSLFLMVFAAFLVAAIALLEADMPFAGGAAIGASIVTLVETIFGRET